MAFPVMRSQRLTVSEWNTSHTINYPATVVAGDRLELWIGLPAARTITATGWTLVGSATNTCQLAMYTRVAAGSEGGGTFSVGLNSAVELKAIVRSIAGADAPQISSPASGTSSTSNPDAPSFTPAGGPDDFLWVAAGLKTGPTGQPDDINNFGNHISDTSGDLSIMLADRQLNASVLNPGNFDANSGSTWVAFTAVHPPGGPSGNAARSMYHHLVGGMR